MNKANKRRLRGVHALFALLFAGVTLALCLKVLTLSQTSARSLTPSEPRPDFLDRPHRHRAAAPALSAQP